MAIRGNTFTGHYIAWDTSANAPKSGDVANHTIYIVKDGTSGAASGTPGEVDATHAPGIYRLVLTALEMGGGCITIAGKSSTANISIIPTHIIPLDLDASKINTIEGKTATIGDSLGAIQGNVNSVGANVSTIQSKVNTMGAAVGEIQGDVNTMGVTVTTILEKVNLLGGATGIYGYTATTATAAGAPIADVIFQVEGTAGNLIQMVRSDMNGHAAVHLNPGSYVWRATKAGQYAFAGSGSALVISGSTTGTHVGTATTLTGSFYSLVVNEGWLKDFDALTGTAASGVTINDKAMAEQLAYDEIRSRMALSFNVGAWDTVVPPFIAHIANMLGSANLIVMKFKREGRGGAELATTLRQRAVENMAALVTRQIALLDTDGNRIE